MQERGENSGADLETRFVFSVLTPVVYLYLSEHLQHILPVTCHVLTENMSVLQGKDKLRQDAQYRKNIRIALNHLSYMLSAGKEPGHE